MQMMNKNGFSRCGENYINRLRKEGRYSTAHVYKNALYSFGRYCGTLNVSFKQVTKERLRRYGQYLYECGLKPNTIGEWKRGVPLMFLDCFMMSIQVWMSGKRKLCLPVNYISFCMKIPNRNVYVVHKLLPP